MDTEIIFDVLAISLVVVPLYYYMKGYTTMKMFQVN